MASGRGIYTISEIVEIGGRGGLILKILPLVRFLARGLKVPFPDMPPVMGQFCDSGCDSTHGVFFTSFYNTFVAE